MKKITGFLLLCLCINASAQKHPLNYYSAALTTLHTDYPFGSFGALVTGEFHPGFEIATGFDWKTKPRHDWFQAFKLGYSYHRFIQHTVSLYTEFGYRHKFFTSFSAESRLGIGYLHAIPAAKIFVLDNDGSYKKKHNVGRPQAMACVDLGISKRVTPGGTALFVDYQQRLQFPFIKSYVPLLPSNMLMIGAKFSIPSKNHH